MPLIVIPIPILLAIAMAIPLPLISTHISRCVPIPLTFALPFSFSIPLTHLHQAIQILHRIRLPKSLIADGPRGIHCITIVGSDGEASEVDAGIELVAVALSEVDTLATAMLVALELPLKFFGPDNDFPNTLGPLGRDLWTGLGATVFGLDSTMAASTAS